ncbi:Rne/Rng family ribonuclease [Nevskia soli]|uniref:Rne/Rng family ribonuclease n=1 Tax=Nevskia soli TaxID=418856 RepID=UPI0015D71E04|nr:Rne/Rng family ribonuclease [Nevskia soli]
MSKELIVSATRHETRVAILEDDQLVEIFHQREKEYSLAGSIHKGRVTRVLPGMQSAFVDIGLERDAFLYVSDFFEDNDEYDKVVSGVEEKVLKLERGGGSSAGGGNASAAPIALPTPMEPELAAILGAVPGALMVSAPAAQSTNGQAATSEPRRENASRADQQQRDRGGRGRRGRRRRPGGGGLPESKFFSPRDHREPRENREPREVRAEARGNDSLTQEAEPSGGLVVLPGESISKYVGHIGGEGEPEGIDATGESPTAELTSANATLGLAEEIVHQEHNEALVDEWEASMEKRREPQREEPEPEFLTGAVLSAAVEVSEEPLAEAELEEEDDEGEEPEAASELPDEQAEEQAEEAFEPGFDAVDVDPVDELQRVSAEPAAEPNPEQEGPEPARIPQSLTATLREQGSRLPHRMSRRMRRRMRGDRPDEKGAEGTGEAAVESAGETPSEGAPAMAAPQIEEVKAAAEPRRQGRGRESRPREDRAREDRPREDRQDKPRENRDREDRNREEARPIVPSIADLLKAGQEIIVQIAKEPLGQKGARITSHIALPGRFLVYMPTVDHVGVSRKIPSDDERLRLKRILQTHRVGIPGGFIVRTAGEGRSEDELKADMMFLHNMWTDMRQKAEKRPAPMLLHHDLDLVERILRDQLTSAFKTVWVDNEIIYENVLSFVQRFQPAMVSRIKMYTRKTPIFDEFGITQELEKALRPKVWLKSGGYIVINQTEALVAIDINTGKYVGKSNRLEDTIVKINTDAIREIVRQIHLRDLGGIIVVDFIDMDERKNRQKVMQALEEGMRVDRAPYKILQFNDFGLVAITRKRVKQSLERTLCSPCPYCEGAGSVKSVTTVISEILQEAHKIAGAVEGDSVMLRVNPEVAKVLKSNTNDHLEEIESVVGRTVMIKSDPLLHQTKFDLA